MNIFALDPSPEISASYHCDQHLNKMILESAQMLSTTLHHFYPDTVRVPSYKSAYPNHPCTVWVRQSPKNVAWLCRLAYALDSIRQSISNCGEHSSIPIIQGCQAFLLNSDKLCVEYPNPDPFIFAGNPVIAIRESIPTVHGKYKEYYRQKHKAWVLDKGKGMTYKNRPIPPFMADLVTKEN